MESHLANGFDVQKEALLTEVRNRLVEAAHPLKVILFGSYARNSQTKDSDLDILVIEETIISRYNEILRLRKVLRGLSVPIDLLVISESDFKERSEIPSSIYYSASKEGRVLYEAA